MDSLYEFAGAQAATALHDALAAVGLPLIVALAGVAWRIFRVAEDGLVRPLAFYVLSLIALIWLIRPVESTETTRVPRFISIVGSGADAVVKTSIQKINKDFLTRPFEYERVAALAGQARVWTPGLRADLTIFLSTCAENALAMTNPVSAEAMDNPLSPRAGLPYDQLTCGGRGGRCSDERARLWQALNVELDGNAIHQSALSSVGPSERDAYLGNLVRNEWLGRVADGGEMLLAKHSVGTMDSITTNEAAAMARRLSSGGGLWNSIATHVGTGVNAVTSWFGEKTQAGSDAVSSKQRYYLVTAHAPIIYGLVLMLLTALFPVAGLWALVPGKWTTLVNYGKVFLSVKLWPVGWALISQFSARRDLGEAFREDAAAGDILVATTLLYFMIPGLSFLVIHLASTAAAVPFRDATPAVAGASSGPVGAAVTMTVRRAL